MTGQHDRQDERLTGQLPNQSGHCPLTGRYFEPWITKKNSCRLSVEAKKLSFSLLPSPRHHFSSAKNFFTSSCPILLKERTWAGSTMTSWAICFPRQDHAKCLFDCLEVLLCVLYLQQKGKLSVLLRFTISD